MADEFTGARSCHSLDRIRAIRKSDLDLLNDAPRALAHDQNTVRHRYGLAKIVRDQQRGQLGGGDRLSEALLQDQLGLRIERGKRLVEQNDIGIDGQRARQSHPLPLPAGYLIGIAVGEFCDPATLEFA